jgi:tRNA threonylcarbamoyl adenosine modification protein YjeE
MYFWENTLMREFQADDATMMEALGHRLGLLLQDGDVVCLTGGLGAGKTTLARGVARSLGVVGHVVSPTFVGVQHYSEARVPLWHADLYRMEEEAEVEQLGLQDWMGKEGVVLIEWPERLGSDLPRENLAVEIAEAPRGRRLRVTGHGARGCELERAWR